MPSERWSLNKEDMRKWGTNLIVFTSPILVVLFTLLANGVPFSKAWPVALLAAYGALADLFKKWSGTNRY